MNDFREGGFKRLEIGDNIKGAKYYIDNFYMYKPVSKEDVEIEAANLERAVEWEYRVIAQTGEQIKTGVSDTNIIKINNLADGKYEIEIKIKDSKEEQITSQSIPIIIDRAGPQIISMEPGEASILNQYDRIVIKIKEEQALELEESKIIINGKEYTLRDTGIKYNFETQEIEITGLAVLAAGQGNINIERIRLKDSAGNILEEELNKNYKYSHLQLLINEIYKNKRNKGYIELKVKSGALGLSQITIDNLDERSVDLKGYKGAIEQIAAGEYIIINTDTGAEGEVKEYINSAGRKVYEIYTEENLLKRAEQQIAVRYKGNIIDAVVYSENGIITQQSDAVYLAKKHQWQETDRAIKIKYPRSTGRTNNIDTNKAEDFEVLRYPTKGEVLSYRKKKFENNNIRI